MVEGILKEFWPESRFARQTSGGRAPDVWRSNPSPGALHILFPSPGVARLIAVFSLTFPLFLSTFAFSSATPWQSNPQGQVRFISSYQIAPEQGMIYFGLQFKTVPGWHLYWKDPGDAGYAPKVTLEGSQGLAQPELLWPMPHRYDLPGDLKAFGYTGEVVYPIRVRVAGSPSVIHAVAHLSYLTCDDSCVPHKYTFILDLPTGANPQIDPDTQPLIDRFVTQVPMREPALSEILTAPSPLPTGQAGPSPLERESKGEGGLLSIVFLAFLGGLILNMMPCVLPVLSIKLFGLLEHSGQVRRVIVRDAMASALGILVSFLGLAFAAVLAKKGGQAVGWGIQFQEPVFVAILAVVVVLFALNLWGVFDIELPAGLAHWGASANSWGEGPLSYFLSGLLATLLATPCSAPFLGTAMGFALAQRTSLILIVFLASGVGMAMPYLVLAAFPQTLHYLPRPGVWMVNMRVVLGFLLAATVASDRREGFGMEGTGASRQLAARGWGTRLSRKWRACRRCGARSPSRSTVYCSTGIASSIPSVLRCTLF